VSIRSGVRNGRRKRGRRGLLNERQPTPALRIPGLDSAQWESESHGFCTGTEGWVEFEVSDDSGVIRLHWNNPFIGSNKYSHTAPRLYQVSYKGGVGDNATVTFEIRCIEAPPF